MRLVILMFVFSTTAAFAACPNLVGLYQVCDSDHGYRTKVRITQYLRAGVATYTMAWNGERHRLHIADGVERTTPVYEAGPALKRKALCDETGVLHTDLEMLNSSGDTELAIHETYALVQRELTYHVVSDGRPFETIKCRR